MSAAATSTDGWEVVIGLETHCQLATASKLFCACPNAFGSPPNANTCPVCTGQPGTLPVLNERAFALAVRAGLALDCAITTTSRFDRKNYFYCDLPKGFQTTQYDEPFATGGAVALDDEGARAVRLTRIHIEEDAGKAIHDRGDVTLVDLNRAGVPLIEIVTEPDLRSAEDAQTYVQRLREILVYAGVSDCDMEKGSLRCDVNVSVRRPGEALRTRVELKNLNSIKSIGRAIEFETARQVAAYVRSGSSDAVEQETRLFDPDTGETRTMRKKEDEEDYRYFPEPDLPPAIATAALLERERAALPELPAARRRRFVDALDLSPYDAGVLTADADVAAFFEASVALAPSTEDAARRAWAKAAANWITNDLLAAVASAEGATTFASLRIDPPRLAQLIGLVEDGAVNSSAARRVLAEMLATGDAAPSVVRALGLEQVSDGDAIAAWCRDALDANAGAVEQVLAGNAKAIGALIGPVMKASGGRANPALVREVMQRLIEERRGGADVSDAADRAGEAEGRDGA